MRSSRKEMNKMKIYLYDQFSEHIISEFDISSADYDLEAVMNIIEWLKSSGAVGGYNKLIIADGYKVIRNESGCRKIKFEL